MKRASLLFAFLLLSLSLAQVQAATNISENAKANALESVSQTLNNQVVVPDSLQIPARIIFGITQSNTINIAVLLALLALWVFLFLITGNILKETPFFHGWTAWAGAFCVTCLIALTGTLQSIILFLFSVGQSFIFFEKWSAGALFFSFIVMFVAGAIILRMLRWMREYSEIEHAKREGFEEGADRAFLKSMMQSLREFATNLKPW